LLAVTLRIFCILIIFIINSLTKKGLCLFVTAAPQVKSEQHEQLKKGSRELPDSNGVKVIPVEHCVMLQIKRMAMITFWDFCFSRH